MGCGSSTAGTGHVRLGVCAWYAGDASGAERHRDGAHAEDATARRFAARLRGAMIVRGLTYQAVTEALRGLADS